MTEEKKLRLFAPGDKVTDLTFGFAKPADGVVTRAHHSVHNAYFVRLSGASNDVVIHARNLKLSTPGLQ